MGEANFKTATVWCTPAAKKWSLNGAGSCGVIVILAARDLCLHKEDDLPCFSWHIEQSQILRTNLMLDIIKSTDAMDTADS